MQRRPTDKLGAQRKSKFGPPKVARACSVDSSADG
jgi:hypothetical protein